MCHRFELKSLHNVKLLKRAEAEHLNINSNVLFPSLPSIVAHKSHIVCPNKPRSDTHRQVRQAILPLLVLQHDGHGFKESLKTF